MRHLISTLLALTLLLLSAPPTLAGPIRAGLKIDIGLAGEGDVEVRGGGLVYRDSDDLLPSAGFSLFGEYEVLEYLSVGGFLGFLWWETDEMAAYDIDHNLAVDLGLSARGQYRFLDGDLMVFLLFRFGLAISDLSNEYEDALGYAVGTGVGANVGLVAGASYRIWESLHLVGELGWQYHLFAHGTEFLGTSVELELSGSQLALNAGAYWEF